MVNINWFLFIVSVGFFILILIIFSREKADYVAFSLLFALITAILTSFLLPKENAIVHYEWITPENINSVSWFGIFLNTIKFKPLLFIMGMQIMVVIAEEWKIFQYIAVKSLHLTRGDHRKFFYIVCVIAAVTAAFIEDVTVAVILVPLVIRACRILRINASPYLYGISITINVGSVLSPFSSSKNILISTEFNLNFVWFIKNLWGFIIVSLILTLFILDLLILRSYDPPTETRRKIFLEIMNPQMVITNRKRFKLNAFYFSGIIFGLILFSSYAPYIAFIGALLMALFNRETFTVLMHKIDFKVIFFFLALFLLIGAMEVNNVFVLISSGILGLNLENTLIIALGVLLFSSLFSGILASNPAAILLIILLRNIFPEEVPVLILIAFFLGINLGGNLSPQGATCNIVTLNLAKTNRVQGFTYRSLFKRGSLFALLHIAFSMIYLLLFSFFSTI